MKRAVTLKPIQFVEQKKPSCYRSDLRFLCRKPCPMRKECLKLIAEWRR